MSADDISPPRRYRFGDPDRTGWILGLGGAQCLALGIAVGIGGMLLSAGQPLPIVLVPLVGGAIYAFGRVGGLPARQWLPVTVVFAVRRAAGRTTWHARLPLLTGRPADGHGQPELPPCLAGLVLREVSAPGWAGTDGAPVAVVEDRSDRAGPAHRRLGRRPRGVLIGGAPCRFRPVERVGRPRRAG